MNNLKKTVIASLTAAMAISAQGVNVMMHTPSGFQVLGMSPNAKWACGVFVDAGGGSNGFRWNLESGNIEMLDTKECTAWDVANDGTVSGDFYDTKSLGTGAGVTLPGYWRDGSWHSMEMPAGFQDGMGASISPDGRYMVGSVATDGIYKAYIWEDGKIVRELPSKNHGVGYAISPDGKAAGGWAMQYNRTACYWGPDGGIDFFMDSPEYSQSPWNSARNFSPDGSKMVYWGGLDPIQNIFGETDVWLYCIYDVKTGERRNVKTPAYNSDLELFDISNSGIAVGYDRGRGVLIINDIVTYIDDYLETRNVNAYTFDDFYGGGDAYVGQLPINNIVAISEDENVLLCTYYNTIGQPASLVIKIDQDPATMVPAEVKAEQVAGVNATAVTWRQPVGLTGLRGYNVYRDGKKLNLLPITQQYYYDKKLADGTYEYVVSCVLANGSENKAEAVSAEIGASPLPAPLAVYARGKGANSALVTWNNPLNNLVHKTYYDPETTDFRGFSIYEPLDIETAVRFTRAELQCYDGYTIEEVSFIPLAEHDGWKVNIYSRNASGTVSLIATKAITQELEYGKLNTVKLDKPVALPSSDIVVAIEVNLSEDSSKIIGAQQNRVVPGYSDLLRIVGEDDTFMSTYESSVQTGYFISCVSWSIDVGLKAPNGEESAVATYGIYVDGEKDGETTDNLYLVRNLTEGSHTVSVEAIYTDGGSSDLTSADFALTNSYPAVDKVAVETVKDSKSEILAKWETPVDFDKTKICYAGDEVSIGIKGPSSLSYAIMAGSIYPSTMFRSYGGYKIDSFRFYPLCDAIFTFMLYENDVKIYEYEVEDFVLGQWNSYDLPDEIIIDETADYMLVIDCFDPEPDTPTLPLDNTAPRPQISDIYSVNNGETWESMTIETGTSGNWMIGMAISDPEGLEYEVEGYDVVIDGEARNTAPVTANQFGFDFGKEDKDLHLLRIDTYYPTRATAVEGGEIEFHISAAGIDLVTIADITLQCGPNYLVVDGEGVEAITLFSASGTTAAKCKGNKLNITDLQAGVYVAQVRANGVMHTRKIRIQH